MRALGTRHQETSLRPGIGAKSWQPPGFKWYRSTVFKSSLFEAQPPVVTGVSAADGRACEAETPVVTGLSAADGQSPVQCTAAAGTTAPALATGRPIIGNVLASLSHSWSEDSDCEMDTHGVNGTDKVELFAGAHGEAAKQYVQRVSSHLVNTINQYSGDPPVAVTANMWRGSMTSTGAACQVYRRTAAAITHIIEQASEGRFMAPNEYYSAAIVAAVVQGSTDVTRRKELFIQQMIAYTQDMQGLHCGEVPPLPGAVRRSSRTARSDRRTGS